MKDELHFFVLQFSVRLLDNKEWRRGLGHVLKGGTIMSVLLFSPSSYKAWKLALRKAAPCLFPWEWYAPNQAQFAGQCCAIALCHTVQSVTCREQNGFEQTAVGNYHLWKSKFAFCLLQAV